jgi:hypothetical protein
MVKFRSGARRCDAKPAKMAENPELTQARIEHPCFFCDHKELPLFFSLSRSSSQLTPSDDFQQTSFHHRCPDHCAHLA